ncbi:4181_t:CDS:2 [Entrophospora sp. SA101]|nr:4181_t:CDS:2 [Entrophospora sp. SA101]
MHCSKTFFSSVRNTNLTMKYGHGQKAEFWKFQNYKIAVCNWSKNEKNRSYLDLGVYSSEIRNVPMLNHIYFSPIHMNCSPARENQRRTQSSHSGLYSGPIGAFLNVHEPLIPAFNWLKKNNRLIKKYASDITRPLPEEPALLQLPVVQ